MKQGLVWVVGLSALLAGCATTSTLIEKRNLEVSSKLSDTIFLDPVPADRQTVFIQIRNTSDKPDFDIAAPLTEKVRLHGWTVVNDLDQATVLLQANVLSAGKMDPAAAASILHNGYGGALASGVVGAATAAATGAKGSSIAIAGLGAGAADYVGSLLVKDVMFAVITDIQVSERTRAGTHVTVSGSQDLRQGTSGGERQTYAEDSEWKRYRSRVLSSAEQVNLEWPAAQPALVDGLAQVIGGVL